MVENKVFFFDMDGTLLPHGVNQTIAKKDLYALNRLEELGYEVVLNTGKSFSMCKDQLKLYNFKTAITSNGQNILSDGEVIYEDCFANEDIDTWIEYAKSNNLEIGFQTNGDQYILNSDNVEKYRKLCFADLNVALPTIIDEFDYSLKVQQIWLLGDVGEIELNDRFDYFRWHESAYDVQLKGINKGSALKKYIEHLGWSNYKIYSFGDGLNDLGMFELSDVSVAMGNASDFVKNKADCVTDSVHDCGVYNYLKNNKII